MTENKLNKSSFSKYVNNSNRKKKVSSLLDIRVLKKRKRTERDPLYQGVITERERLKARLFDLNLQARLGKLQVVGNSTVLSQQSGYYCSVTLR